MFFRGQIIGKYKILSTIGSGGFGTVYLAEDTWIDKKVALKVPHKQGVDFGELLREPRLLASLNHPNIVTILTAEKQENVFFIVMEFVPGETLEAIIARDGALDCRAGARLHLPDLQRRRSRAPPGRAASRPAARRTCWSPNSGMLKVADFGTSRFLEIAAHGTTVIGSPPYMAPEQFQGKAVFASDIYSLGVTMYQMLTGDLPYDTPSPADLDRLMRGELVTRAAAEESEDPEGDQRHRAEGDGAGDPRIATSAPANCWTMCWRRGASPRRRRRRRRKPTAATTRRARTSTAASRRAKRRSLASAGTAGSRSTPARIAARSAAKPSSCRTQLANW